MQVKTLPLSVQSATDSDCPFLTSTWTKELSGKFPSISIKKVELGDRYDKSYAFINFNSPAFCWIVTSFDKPNFIVVWACRFESLAKIIAP